MCKVKLLGEIGEFDYFCTTQLPSALHECHFDVKRYGYHLGQCPSVDIGNSLHVYAEFAKVESAKILLPPTFYCRYCAFAEQVEFMVPFP